MNHLNTLRQELISRDYFPKIVDQAFEKLVKIERKEALKKVERTATSREVMVVTFNPGLPSVTKIIKKHWKVMTNRCPRLKRCFAAPSMVAYKRPKSLQEELESQRRSSVYDCFNISEVSTDVVQLVFHTKT